MQEQYEIFRQNGYSREQANLILFLDIQAQRQRVYPDGSTGSVGGCQALQDGPG